MFKKMLSGLGIQGIQVDTQLHNHLLEPGQIVHGEVIFQGGASDKNINGIYLHLNTMAEVEAGDHEYQNTLTIQQWHLSSAFQLKAHARHQFPFSVQLPFETPITEVACRRNHSRVWLHTHLDVDWGLDASDKDYLQIVPSMAMQAFIQAMQHCGFVLATVDVEQGQLRANHFSSTIGCYQELEFVPQGLFHGINEVEVSFVAEAHQTHIMLEIDRKFRGDQLRSLTIPHHNIQVPLMVQSIKQLLNIA